MINADMAVVRKEAIEKDRVELWERRAKLCAAAKRRVEIACEERAMKGFCYQDHERRVAERRNQAMQLVASSAAKMQCRGTRVARRTPKTDDKHDLSALENDLTGTTRLGESIETATIANGARHDSALSEHAPLSLDAEDEEMSEHLRMLRRALAEHRNGIFCLHSDDHHVPHSMRGLGLADGQLPTDGTRAPTARPMARHNADQRLHLAASSYLHTIQAFRPPPLSISADRTAEEAGVVYTPRHNDNYSSAEAREAMERAETAVSPVLTDIEAIISDFEDDESESSSGSTTDDIDDSGDDSGDGSDSVSDNGGEGYGAYTNEMASTASCDTSSESTDERGEDGLLGLQLAC